MPPLHTSRHRTMQRRNRRWLSAAGLLPAMGLAIYAALLGISLLTGRTHRSGSDAPPGMGCIAWRHTLACSPLGARVPSGDRSCNAIIRADAGYCECTGGWTTHRSTCGYHKPYTCADACRQLSLDQQEALQFPAPLNCANQGPYLAERYIKSDDPAWAATAASMQASAGADKIAAVAGVRRLAVADDRVHWQHETSDGDKKQQHAGQPQQQPWTQQRQQQRQQQYADISTRPERVSDQQGSHTTAQWSHELQQTDSKRRRLLASAQATGAGKQKQGSGTTAALPATRSDKQVAALWGQVEQALLAAGPHAVKPPGTRTNAADFVRLGLRMDRHDVQRAQQQWRAFLAEAPAYPSGVFSDRGVVILSGSLPYMVPAWVNLHMLRLTGCKLPVEMWFPELEAPSLGLAAALARLGATVRLLPHAAARAGGFTMKAATILLSGFEEVLFLDADNIAMRDPSPLFDSAGYNATGALLWPDYWERSAAPDLADILGLDPEQLPAGTTESGQMVLHKRRLWRGLLLATFLNVQSGLYYELLSNFMGKGDKETFPYAFKAVNASYSTIGTPVGSVGITKMHCNKRQRHCWHEFAGNTMLQHDEQGQPIFLHTNFEPKMDLQLPLSMDAYTRRWQLVVPRNRPFAKVTAPLGRDLEREAFEMLSHFRCAPWLPELLRQQGAKAPPPLQGFHPLHNGMDFRRPYRWGMSGPYLHFTKMTFGDKVKHYRNRWVRPWLARHGFGKWAR